MYILFVNILLIYFILNYKYTIQNLKYLWGTNIFYHCYEFIKAIFILPYYYR